MKTVDWLNTSTEDFVRRYAPHAAPPKPSEPLKRPAVLPMRPVAAIATGNNNSTLTTNGQAEQMTKDEHRLLVAALMNMPSDEVVNFKGEMMPASEALKRMMKGESVVIHAEQPEDEARRGSVQPTQRAIDALSDKEYRELEQNGIEGLTTPLKTRVNATSSNYGGTVNRLRIDPDSGKVNPAEPVDYSKGLEEPQMVIKTRTIS